MVAIISWRGGQKVFEDSYLGDPRIADALDSLAKAGVTGVSLDFL